MGIGTKFKANLIKGRGAFESHEASEAEQQPSAEQANAPRYVQQYDERGYPRNAETEESRDIQVAAMNEVLAAVGVCEKKNEEDRLARQRSFSPQEWELIRVAEDYHSEIVSTVAECIRHASTWWISSVRKRIQVGRLEGAVRQALTRVLIGGPHLDRHFFCRNTQTRMAYVDVSWTGNQPAAFHLRLHSTIRQRHRNSDVPILRPRSTLLARRPHHPVKPIPLLDGIPPHLCRLPLRRVSQLPPPNH